MVEYVLVLVLLFVAATTTGWLIRAINAQANRTQLLLSSDFP